MSHKYDSPRDEVLHAMASEGWATESSGDVEAPTGWFAYMTNTEPEVMGNPDGIASSFADAIAEAGLTDPTELIGSFLLREDSQGFAYVDTFDSHAELLAAYRSLESEYDEWADDGEGDAD